MSYSKASRYSRSPSPYKRYSSSVLRSLSRSRSRSRDSSVENPGNNLYVTGLSTRVTKKDLEKHFSTEGKCDADLPVTLHILGVVLPDTHLYEIEADHILLTTVGGDHTLPTLPVTAREGHIPDLVPRTVGHLLADVNAPTLLMAQDTIHLTVCHLGLEVGGGTTHGVFHHGAQGGAILAGEAILHPGAVTLVMAILR
ncbi:RNA-binding (RRM/RBD/RNP motifs) family protein [Actinidia rufa]|uniref:RNA-binding (RRM/RBD/RNP motifs) family protein n=1 Tax=Actinidia rufa TaxID=165716 RepID=A0A7J0GR82_9ERIC|nr:RNA-binding (RRM/RBD/RNP motifs) family protein [Actinidia rufa]